MTRAALIDVDGTLVDSVDGHARAWSEALALAGFTIAPNRIRPLIGMGGDHVLPQLVPGLRDDAEPGRSILADRKRLFRERELSLVTATNGARELLLALRARGSRIVIASSSERDDLEALLERGGVADLIDVVSTSDDAKASKPEPDIVAAALAKAGVAAAEAVMVGDTRYDIEAAHRAHVACVALRCGGSDPATLVEAEAVYDDPRALAASLDRLPFAWTTASSMAV